MAETREGKSMNNVTLLEMIRSCNVGDTIIWDEPNGEVCKIKLEKRYPKDWKYSQSERKVTK